MAEAKARALILGRREKHSKAKREADDGAGWQHLPKAHAAATENDVGHDLLHLAHRVGNSPDE
jgi:hypothetical protein